MSNTKPAQALGDRRYDPVAASVHIFTGDIVVLDASGDAKPGVTGTGLLARGMAFDEVDNSAGIAGALFVTTRTGSFAVQNSISDPVDQTTVGDVVYIEDSKTVCKTATGKSVAGVHCGFDSLNPIVAIGVWPTQVGLLAANNLSDVGTPATARANIGANEIQFNVYIDDLVSADATRFGFVAPRAFTITSLRAVVLKHALAGGNATLTGKIAGTAITGGVLTLTQAGSAIGDKFSASPSALNVCAAGDFVELLLGGSQTDTSARAMVTVFGTY